MLEVLTLAVLFNGSLCAVRGKYNEIPETLLEKQGGEYSAFEETGRQDQGLPNDQANPIPQVPSTGIEADGNTRTETADTFVEPSCPSS